MEANAHREWTWRSGEASEDREASSQSWRHEAGIAGEHDEEQEHHQDDERGLQSHVVGVTVVPVQKEHLSEVSDLSLSPGQNASAGDDNAMKSPQNQDESGQIG